MSAPIATAARALWRLRRDYGDDAFAEAFGSLPAGDQARLVGSWQLCARDVQLRPEDSNQIWLLNWGRGAGKTRSAAEETLDKCEAWGSNLEGALISKTITDTRKTMIRGGSGLQACARRRGYEVDYKTSDKMVYHPSGALLHVMSAEQDEVGRGPNLNWFWADEAGAWLGDAHALFLVFLASWRMPAPTPSGKPEGVISMTPKPNVLSRYLLSDERAGLITVAPPQSTFDNRAIDPSGLVMAYGGSGSLERQELWAELSDSGVLVEQDVIDRRRVVALPETATDRVVALDPSIDDKDTSDAAGIVAMARDDNRPPHAYVCESLSLQGASWAAWAHATIDMAIRWKARKIIAECNQGGKGVIEQLAAAKEAIEEKHGTFYEIEIGGVWHQISKRARAEPVAAKVHQGRCHFLNRHDQLEKELRTWVEGAPSPNVMDAWAMAGNALFFPGDSEDPGAGFLAQHGSWA